MLKYKTVKLLFLIAFILLFAAGNLWGRIYFQFISVIFIVYLGCIAWGAYFIHSGFFVESICKGNTNKNEIAISFDDGPTNEITPSVLDLLKEYNVKASFFCIGKNISGREEIIKRMHDEGHVIGNHSWSHNFFFDFYRDWKVEEELTKTNEEIKKITGQDVKYFRPPYGVTNPVIARVVTKLKMPVIGWSIRSLDTSIKNQDILFNRVIKNIKPGDIVLFHDSHPIILPVLKRFLDYVKDNGFEVVGLEGWVEKSG